MPDLNHALSMSFIKELVATQKGRAKLLAQCSDAEDSGESRLFDRLAARVEDPALQRLIQRHQADEVRHAKLFKERAEAVGIPLEPVPEDLKIIERLNEALDGVFDRPITSSLDVMEAYLLLQVLEERAVTQFPMFEEAFRPVDPVTADTFAEIARDEERHLRYCHAISRRYAPDEATRVATLERFRAAEAEAFTANSRANVEHSMANGIVEMGPLKRLMWKAIGAVSRLLQRQQLTRFSQEPELAAA